MVGLLLGDLFIQSRGKSGNTRLFFEQGIIHKDYLYHLFDLFKPFCLTEPKEYIHKIRGKSHLSLAFKTLTFPCFKEFYDLFYPTGVKVVPVNIQELMTPLALAYWIADDGGFCQTRQRLTLATHSFTVKDVELLSKILNEKFTLECAVHKHCKHHVITMPAKSLPVLQELLAPHMPSAMRHKIGLS